jgi:soluble lytic murein transglycosylase-like protein
VARRSRKGKRARWIDRVFWIATLALAGWFSVERVVPAVVSANGFRRVEAHAPLIRAAARESRVDPNLLAGIALAESSGRPDAVSSKDALGMFQLMLPTARERARKLGLAEPSRADLLADPALNARLAAAYLRWLLERYGGDPEKALVAYNAGPGRLDGWIREHGDYPAWRSALSGKSSVLAYSAKVLRYRDRFVERGIVAPAQDVPAPHETTPTEPPVYGPLYDEARAN